jgi:hypothetical protein
MNCEQSCVVAFKIEILPKTVPRIITAEIFYSIRARKHPSNEEIVSGGEYPSQGILDPSPVF